MMDGLLVVYYFHNIVIAESGARHFLHEQHMHSTFTLTLHKTYYNHGFFNVPVSVDTALGKHADRIQIVLADTNTTLEGYIDRHVNRNGSSRIMGGAALRDWWQHHYDQGATLEILITSRTSLVVS